jgi:FkbM family methyltransferase
LKRAPQLAYTTTVLVLVQVAPQTLLTHGLEQWVWAVQSAGYALIDTIYVADRAVIAFRKTTQLTEDELRVWLTRDGRDVGLVHSEANDLLRLFPVLGRHFYEQDMLEHILSRSAGGMIVDAGAHIGNHSLFLGAFGAARVFSFEPAPASFACLESNIRINGLGDRIAAFNCALGASDGVGGSTAVGERNSGATRFNAGGGSLPMRRLDDVLVGAERLDAMKIDVEGMEAEVISGALGLVRRFLPDLYIELLNPEAIAAIEAILLPLGYRRLQSFGQTLNQSWEFRARAD